MSLVGLTNGRWGARYESAQCNLPGENRFPGDGRKNGNSAACNSNSAGVGFLSQFLLDKNENLPACSHTCLLAHIRILA